MTAKESKTLKSKFGREFRLVSISRPREGSVVFLTYEEWTWIKARKLSSEEFDFILRAKADDHHHPVITDEVLEERREVAVETCKEVLAMLKAKQRVEREETPKETMSPEHKELSKLFGDLIEQGKHFSDANN